MPGQLMEDHDDDDDGGMVALTTEAQLTCTVQ